ncbi:MAG: hypothetical protein ACRCUE_16895 [Bosea sp. (in: a-proteobacteria)]
MTYAIKTQIDDPDAERHIFERQKTMYDGKRLASGDTIFLFASENEGGQGLVAKAVVTAVEAVPRKPDLARQTPRISLTVKVVARALRRLGRDELKSFSNWTDGRPETELNFKFYRQATNKVIGVTASMAAFLEEHF